MYEQIYQYIKDEIRKGNIRPEKQLPSSRELAKSLKVSRSANAARLRAAGVRGLP
ncbi:MAG: GntR family transcriptional regulator [Pilosibacter sp.]